MAKGVIYSITALIIGGLILTLAITIFNTSQETELRATETNIANRAYELQTSISKSIKTLFQDTATIDISTSNNIITIKENLKNNGINTFKNNITELKNFIQENSPEAILKTETIDTTPIEIKPHSIKYNTYNPLTQTVNINADNSPYNGIKLTINTNETLGILSFTKIASGSIPLTVIIKNNLQTITQTATIDTEGDTELTTQNMNLQITIQVATSDIQLKVDTTKTAGPLNLTTELTLKEQGMIKAGYTGIIQINYPEFKVYSTADAIIS